MPNPSFNEPQARRRTREIRFVTLLSAATVALTACVTINIYFPAAAAEKAADKIIDEVWQLRKNGESSASHPASVGESATQGAGQ